MKKEPMPLSRRPFHRPTKEWHSCDDKTAYGFPDGWFIDYNGNNVSGGSEPTSPNFGTSLLWNFTVSNVTGTYHYRSDRTAGPGDDLTTMWGNITISANPPSNPLLPGGENT